MDDILFGIHTVLECLKSRARPIDRIYFAQGVNTRNLQAVVDLARQQGIPFKFEPRAQLDRKSGGATHQGVVAVCTVRPYSGLEDLLASAGPQPLLVLLDSIEDPRNLGAILRSCAAFGVDGVVVPKNHAAGLSAVVAKTAEGALEYLKVAKVTNLVQAIEQLKAAGIWVIGIESGQTKQCDEVDFMLPVALVLGNEGSGIRRLVREHCDLLAALPAGGAIHSLNVSVAAGIALYEVIRQRRRGPKTTVQGAEKIHK